MLPPNYYSDTKSSDTEASIITDSSLSQPDSEEDTSLSSISPDEYQDLLLIPPYVAGLNPGHERII